MNTNADASNWAPKLGTRIPTPGAQFGLRVPSWVRSFSKLGTLKNGSTKPENTPRVPSGVQFLQHVDVTRAPVNYLTLNARTGLADSRKNWTPLGTRPSSRSKRPSNVHRPPTHAGGRS